MEKKYYSKFFILLALFIAFPVHAAVAIPTIAGIPENASAAELITYFFNLAITVGSFIAVVMLIMAGVEYIMSQGNPAKIEDAKKKILNAFLGIVVLMGSLIILNIINPELTVIKINDLEDQQSVEVPEIKSAGVYLYKENGDSLIVKITKPSLVQDNFHKQTQSIEFDNPENYKYGAVLFTEGDLRGNCSYVLNNISNLGSSNGVENYPPIGNNNLSSILVFKVSGDSPTIKLYNTIDCKARSSEYETIKENTSVCEVSGVNGFKNIKESCPDLVGSVLSIETSANAGILLKAANKDSAGQCQFLKPGNSRCINVIKYSYVYNSKLSSLIKPLSYIVFPLYTE
ncbi:MAG: pilin [Minisyncoccales bacterium]